MSRELPGAVLFACSQNAIRSPIAAALMRHLYGSKVRVQSVGLRAGDGDPFAAAVMDEIGIDMSAHRPQDFEAIGEETFDLVVSLSPEAHHRALEFTRTMAVDAEYWPTQDPSAVEGSREQILDAYREVRDGLMKRIRGRFGSLGAPGV
jgi:protein-tyrosine-phosphatase